MLETILNKTKSLIKKVKKPFIATLAGFTLLAISNGCTTIGNKWKTISTYHQILEKREFENHKIIYKIKDPIIENNLLTIPITELRTIETYKLKERITKELQAEYNIQKLHGDVIGGLIGFVIGAAIGYAIGYAISPDKEDPWPVPLMVGLFGGLGGGGGAAIGKNNSKIRETLTGSQRTITTNRSTIEEFTDTKTKEESPAETYVSITSREIKFKELNEFEKPPQKEITVYSKNGEAKVKVIEDILEFEFKKQDLIDQIKTWKQIRQIKEPTRSQLLPLILNYIKTEVYEIDAKTSEQSAKLKEVTNDEETIFVSGYQLSPEKIYLVLEDFINTKINSKIKEVRIKVKDASTHTSVRNATLEVRTTAPTKTEIAKQYFEDNLLEWSTTKIKEYITGKETVKYDDRGIVVFSAYIPNNYNTETTNPNYRFVNLNFDFSEGKLRKTIYMSKDPKLIKIVDE